MSESSDDNVVVLDVATRLPVPVERVLRGALEAGLESVIVMGILPDGEEYIATSLDDMRHVAWLADRVRHRMHRDFDAQGGGT